MSSTALATAADAASKTPEVRSVPPYAPTPPPGTWRHPKLDEIARRQSASIFSQSNLRRAIISIISLALTFYIPSLLPTWAKLVATQILLTGQAVYESHRSIPPKELEPYMTYAMHAVRALLLTNLFFTLSPLWARKDELEDIPLTPSQRKKLGLGPSSAPATPGSAQYITPPRYARSTSRSASSSRAATVGSTYRERSPSGSPINGSPLAGRGVGNTSIWGTGSSPSGSPWVRKAVEGRRLSSGGRLPSGSPLSKELALDDSLRVQGTPTPAGGSRASVQLNSKWLYQKRSDSPGSRGLYT
jgi:nucleoporin POM34